MKLEEVISCLPVCEGEGKELGARGAKSRCSRLSVLAGVRYSGSRRSRCHLAARLLHIQP